MFVRKSRLMKSIFLFTGLILIFGCSNEPDKMTAGTETPAKTMENKTLVLYNWEEYIGSKTLENFEKETGIHVQEIYFQDEEEMLGAVQSDLKAYDLVVCSGDLVREMQEAKILAQLDFSKIPNFKYISKQYINRPSDPEQKYSIPYLWGTTGMVVNTKYIKEDTDSWQVLFNQRYKGKTAMLNNSFEVMSAASKLLGYSINDISAEKFAKMKPMLHEQKPLLQGYLDAVTIKDLLIEEKLWAAQIYSGEGLTAVDENENLAYVIPKEGAPIWVDHFAMPRHAQHKEEAHIFLNYILRPEVNAAIASELWYATPNEAATPHMDPEVTQSASVYPTADVRARCEPYGDTGEATPTFTRIWTDLLAKQ
jgi:spermidine/putrescine transport system substrate-binding protein